MHLAHNNNNNNNTQSLCCASHTRINNVPSKATIRPDFFGTVPNFDGLSWENYEVFRDAELSLIPNPVPILSRFECSVTSHVAADHFDGLIPSLYPNSCQMRSFKLNAPQTS